MFMGTALLSRSPPPGGALGQRFFGATDRREFRIGDAILDTVPSQFA
jgi:hypothetical protein